MAELPVTDDDAIAVGFDVTAMSVASLKAAGVRVVPSAIVTVTRKDPVWLTHSEYEGRSEVADRMARAYARYAARRHFDAQCRRVACALCRAKPGEWCHGRLNDQVVSSHPARQDAARAAGLLTLEGLTLSRTFPCLGKYRVREQLRAIKVVECDRCGDEMGVRIEPEKPDDDAFDDREASWSHDDIPL